ncbi:MAG: MarR family transcriptional regulator [Actinomycetota bacterium]|nr:MarR family transcriptional regulator [Actinomycetota bacterium]
MDPRQAELLNSAIRTISIRHRALAAALLAPLGLHPGQEVLLFELHNRGPLTQGQLASASGCEPPTITNSARRLEAAGLLVRTESPDDARVTIVDLSDRGRALLPALQQAWTQLAEQSVARLLTTPPERLVEDLSDLASSLEAARARCSPCSTRSRSREPVDEGVPDPGSAPIRQ